jgi:hypothetical protein
VRIIAIEPRAAEPPAATDITQNVTTEELAPPPQQQQVAQPPTPVPPVTAQVVLDQDRSMIPRIAAFGMVTLIVSAVVFFKAER